jgi:hypothetical protein
MRRSFAFVTILLSVGLSVSSSAAALSAGAVGLQGHQHQDYAGAWKGSYASDSGGTGDLSFLFTKNAKGQWGGTVKYTNQNGEQAAPFKTLQFAGSKMTATLETPDGQATVTIQATFNGDHLEGAYSVASKDSGGAVDGGKFTLTKSASKGR